MTNKGIHYHEYLKINTLLSCQNPESEKRGRPAHDEMLFIIVHQAYELWFKQILHEVESVRKIFAHPRVDERDMDLIVQRLHRVVEIQRLLLDQITVLETMTPLDFLEFRDLLFPASGFQSFQFRLLENRLGLKSDQRMPYNHMKYHEYFSPEQAAELRAAEENTLFDGVDAWLARTPFVEMEGFSFWQLYMKAVRTMFTEEQLSLKANPLLNPDHREKATKMVEKAASEFEAVFNPDEYARLQGEGRWRLSYRALHAALLIQLYRHQPALQLPFRVLTTLQDIDEMMTTWRSRHALMARRMLGAKIGTGGSSGSEYLQAAADRHKIFSDFFQLTTFFIPRSALPPLPTDVETKLGFR